LSRGVRWAGLGCVATPAPPLLSSAGECRRSVSSLGRELSHLWIWFQVPTSKGKSKGRKGRIPLFSFFSCVHVRWGLPVSLALLSTHSRRVPSRSTRSGPRASTASIASIASKLFLPTSHVTTLDPQPTTHGGPRFQTAPESENVFSSSLSSCVASSEVGVTVSKIERWTSPNGRGGGHWTRSCWCSGSGAAATKIDRCCVYSVPCQPLPVFFSRAPKRDWLEWVVAATGV
jgi:hypothetical protein